jgi:hypothetical protein
MVSRHKELTCSQTRDDRGRFASGRMPPPPPTSSGSSVSSSSLMHVWVNPPPMAMKKEEVVDVDDSSPFDWTLSKSEDDYHDPHIMRVSQVNHIELFRSFNYSCY